MEKVVVIDPGHGKPDVGAVGYSKKTYEMDINLKIAKKLKSILDDAGYKAILTRDTQSQKYTDKTKDLQYRCDIANDNNASVFISIHCNSSSSPKSSGFEAYTSKGKTRADILCDIIYDMWKAAFPDMKIRKGNLDYTEGKESNLYVLKHTKAPAVLVELGFINNEDEEKLLNSDIFYNKAPSVLASAIEKFLA